MKRRPLAWGIIFFLVMTVILFAVGRSFYQNSVSSNISAKTTESSVLEKKTNEDNAMDPLPAKTPKSQLQIQYCKYPLPTTCETQWPSVDPTGRVWSDVSGEVRALRKLRGIIHAHPDWTSEAVQVELTNNIYTVERREKVNEVFLWVQSTLMQYISDQPPHLFSDVEKQTLLTQLKKIKLELPPPISVYADAIDLVTKNTVYYERTQNGDLRLRVGGAYLINTTSWYNLIFTFAHELAHAIDPCEIQQINTLPSPYKGLISCFVNSGWVTKDKTQCGSDEHISEVFADWLAASIVGQSIATKGKSYSLTNKTRAAINAVRDLCEQFSGPDSLNLRSHQRPGVRIGSIVGRNPSVRKALQCKNDIPLNYCHFQMIHNPNTTEHL
jgi:hypothetical protein